MEKPQHPFDDFLKETLKGHQLVPGENARKAFLEDAATIKPAGWSWFRWYYLPVLFIVISGIVALSLFLGDNHDLSGVIPENEKEVNQSKPEPAINSNDPVERPGYTETVKLSATDSPVEVQMPVAAEVITEIETVPTKSFMDNRLSVDTVLMQPETDYQEEEITLETPGTLPDTAPLAANQSIEDTVPVGSEPEQQIMADAITKPGMTIAGGIYYLPEMMFNTIEGNKFVNNFGLEFVFYRGRTSLTTGAGISVSKGITENAVEYNEFLGTYNKLDSISFDFNESLSDFTPTIHTSSEKVWDSLLQFDSTEIIKRYTYLQIPLLLGFDFWDNSKIAIGVRVGTIMSLMLSSRQITGTYDPGTNQLVGINKLSPDLVSINWQAVGGINGSFLLSNRLNLEIEPQVRYYYQSIYEKSDGIKKPWSVGLRAALLFKF